MESIKIVFFCILSACFYGIANDLVTAHVCVEYFLPPAHPVIVPTTNPVLLALVWGVTATWWVGLFLGIPLAFACRFGSLQKLTVRHIARPVLFLLAYLFIASMLLGTLGYISGRMNWVWLLPPVANAVAQERHALFLFDLWAHVAGYLLGAAGGIVLMVYAWKKRRVACPR